MQSRQFLLCYTRISTTFITLYLSNESLSCVVRTFTFISSLRLLPELFFSTVTSLQSVPGNSQIRRSLQRSRFTDQSGFQNQLTARTSMGQGHWKVNRSSVSRELPSILGSPKVHYGLHKGLLLVPVLGEINPVHAVSPCLRSILISSSRLRYLPHVSSPKPCNRPLANWGYALLS